MTEQIPRDSDERLGITRYEDGSLFPPHRVPSFAEVVGADAAAEYTRIRDDLDRQELEARRRRRRTSRPLGRRGLAQ